MWGRGRLSSGTDVEEFDMEEKRQTTVSWTVAAAAVVVYAWPHGVATEQREVSHFPSMAIER